MRHLMVAFALLIAVVSLPKASEYTLVSDEELDAVYAQGLSIISGIAGDIIESTIGEVIQTINLSGPLDLSGSVIISENAQSNSMNVVNAANSAVNASYNIFIIIESTLDNPVFNLTTILDAINGSTVP